MLRLGCHIHPKIFGETQQNATTDGQISFPSIPTERQENKTEFGAEKSLRSLTCSAEYRSKRSVVFYVSAKPRPTGERKLNFGRSTLSMGDMKWSPADLCGAVVCFKKTLIYLWREFSCFCIDMLSFYWRNTLKHQLMPKPRIQKELH